jgi:glycosyltransferase involved in cell wall biosynthesis
MDDRNAGKNPGRAANFVTVAAGSECDSAAASFGSMRLVYIVWCFPRVSETFVLQEVQELRRQGDDVVLCSLRRPPANEPLHPGAGELARETTYVPRPWHLTGLPAAALAALARAPRRALPVLLRSARWALRERRPAPLVQFAQAAYLWGRLPRDADHLHAHYADAPARVAFVLSRLTGLPFSFTAHAYDIFERPPSDLAELVGAARFAAAVSRHTRDRLAELVAAEDRSKIVVVANGVDPHRFPARADEPDGAPVVLSVGRLVEKKGLDTLLEACALLMRQGVRFRCELIGEGPLRRRLEDRARSLGIEESVRFLGNRDQSEVRAAYERAAVFALPCRRSASGDQDGLPVALTEALAVGVPAVTTPVSGIPELVRDGSSGMLVPPEDPQALAGAIERLLRDATLRRALAEGGREAVAPYDLERCVAALKRLFRE